MRFPTVLSTIALAFAVVPATAVSAEEAPTVTVETNDLDLTNPADQQRLTARIESQVRMMCRSRVGGVLAHKLDKQCRATALANSDAQVQVAIAHANSNRVLLAATRSQNPEA